MDPYIQPFTKSCIQVFKSLLGIEITPQVPFVFDKPALPVGDISGVIGLTGDARGVVAISMNKEVAFQLTSILTGKTYTDLDDDDVRDAVGEIVNIIAGNGKQGLETILPLVISLPTIIRGNNHSISWPGGEDPQVMCVPFKIGENERVILSVTLLK